MNVSILFSNIHWLPVAVVTVFSVVIRFAWHQKFLFGTTWTEENKPTLEKKMIIPLVFGGTAVMHFIAFAGLGAVVSNMG